MHEELRKLGEALCRPGAAPAVDEAELRAAAADVVVVIPAGGFGYRMRGVEGVKGAEGVTQKSLLPLPNGETLIGRLVREYAAAGFRRFLALVNHEGSAVEEHLAGGAPWGVEIRCSYDPDSAGSGRTGAMVHAMSQGLLTEDRPVIVHNADCQLMRYAGSFPHDLLRAHVGLVRERQVIATLAAVDGTPHPFTGLSVADGLVTGVEMYPFIPVPTHTGITALAGEALVSLRENAARSKQNFERDMFPRWAAAGRLGAMVISHENWIAVDDRKAYRIFSQAVEEEGRPSPAG